MLGRLSTLALLWLVGCASTTTPLDAPLATDAASDASPPPALEGVAARVYTDIRAEDRTRRVDGIGAEDVPRSGVTVRLLGSDRTAVTDANGVASFEGVASGRYLFDTGLTNGVVPTTHDAAEHVVAAIDRGGIRITTLGDSLPVYGGSPRFDAVLEELLTPLARVTRNNLAIAGTTTRDWAVGGENFATLAPYMGETDLFIVSLGGNDILQYLSTAMLSSAADIGPALEGARAEARAVTERMLAIVAALRADNPDADFAYLVYPAYAESTAWQSFIERFVDPSLAPAALSVVRNTLRDAIREMLTRLAEEDLVLVDLYQLSRSEPIDPLLFDELHFTTFGHRRVAEELFLSLGGIEVGGSPNLAMPYELGLR